MSDTEFTPGPWVLRNDYVGVADDSDTQSYGMLLLIAAIDRFDFEPQWKANAQLIAAAPELYRALDEAVKDLVAYQVNARIASRYNSRWEGVSELVQPTIDSGRAALAKARGEKS